MKKFVFLVMTIFIVTTLFVGCSAGTTNNYYTGAQVPNTTTGDKTNVTVKVVNLANDLPIDKALITFKEIAIKGETNSLGVMTEMNMTAQKYTLLTEKDFYTPDEQSITPTGDFNITIKLKKK